MKKILLSMFILGNLVSHGQAIIDSTTERTRINADIVPNGTRSITAAQLNRILQGFLNIWPRYTVDSLKLSNDSVFYRKNKVWVFSHKVPLSGSAWNVLGNTGTVPGTNFIGTVDAQDLVFKTAGSEIARFSGDGNVRITFGGGNIASGLLSLAMGGNTTASGDGSTSTGAFTVASGAGSTAMGQFAVAGGSSSFAVGDNVTATGFGSVSMGTGGLSSGAASFSMGSNSIASGSFSTSIGEENIASGGNSTSLGFFSKSKSYGGTVIGTFNDTTDAADPLGINPANRIFQIGTGLTGNSLSNAMTVLQNGNVGIATLTPSAKLHVNGANGFRYVDGNQASGRVITSDANGVATWTSPSALGLTLQQAITAGATLTGSNVIGMGAFTLRFAPANASSLFSIGTFTTANAMLSVHQSVSGFTAASFALRSENASTNITTGGAFTTYGIFVKNSASRSSGANDLTNIGLQVEATGAQNNIAIVVPPSSGSVGIGTLTTDSLLTVELGIRGKRGVRFDGLPTFADTSNYKPVVVNSSGTLYKATYWPGGTNIVASADFVARSATNVITTYTTPNNSTMGIYNVSAHINVTAVGLGGILTTTVTYFDETNTSQIVSFFGMGLTSAAIGATGVSNFPVMGELIVYPNTLITVTTTLAVGTATYNHGGSITFIRPGYGL